jgi:uncharacterized protein (TIGR03437 family)
MSVITVVRLTVLLAAGLAAQAPRVYCVAPDGSDLTGDGSAGRPWATLSHASSRIPDNGSTVIVHDGVYSGRVRLHRRFTERAIFRAENPYRARLENPAVDARVVTVFGGANFEISRFEITRPSPNATAAILMQVQQSGGVPAEDIIIRNNIFHDSYNNDLLKVNNVARRILVEGNLFYNQQGHDEHIDVNGVTDVTIRDNVFLNDFAGSGRSDNDTGSYVVIKNSAGLPENRRIQVQRNVFLNWEGSSGSYFVLVGEDGKPFHEAEEVLIENNLMIGNSPNRIRAPFGVKGAKDVTFRNNTIVGDLPANAFVTRLNREGLNPVNERTYFYNNIWSDPIGTMGDFSDGDPAETTEAVLDNNLYWNNGQPIPSDAGVLSLTDDPRSVVADPRLPGQEELVLPRWRGDQFLSSNRTIREEFERLVTVYGAPGPGSAAIGRSDPARSPVDDIFGRPRDGAPDLGAFEVNEQPPDLMAVTDSAAYALHLAPGGLATLWGEDLSEVTAKNYQTVLPHNLAGVEVLVDGRTVPLWYVSPFQINFQMPYEVITDGKLIVRRTGFSSAEFSYTAAQTAPAIFLIGELAAITHSTSGRLVTAEEPVQPGEFISIWATGLGALAAPLPSGEGASEPISVLPPVTVLLNGTEVAPAYAGMAIGFAGLNQINVEVPSGLSGSVRLEVQAGDAMSQSVTLFVAE